MSGLWKLAATVVVWVVPAMVMFLARPYQGDVVWLTLILATAATVSTRYIWQEQAAGSFAASGKPGKSKRNDRTTRLADLLDEDELDDLEAWLAARRDSRLVDIDR